MLAVTANRCLARNLSLKAAIKPMQVVRFAGSSAKDDEQADPMEVFDSIDTNGDGVLSRDEFQVAVEKMNYSDLVKIKKSLARNELSFNPTVEEESLGSTFMRRMQVTAEVGVSKIFPAGFGWQTAAALAEGAGMQSTDMGFFVMTGIGDGLGVLAGHSLWMIGKKAITGDESINIKTEVETGLLLGSAAFCSGSVWQMNVNALQAANWSFDSTMIATTGVCGLAFFSGLRLSRLAYGHMLEGVESPTYANLKADAALSVAVGGAAGCFVGTDVTYGAANWLRPIVGVEEFHAATTASVLAGSSTFIGFGAVQTVENFVYPKDKCWVD
mmetsp:Transcript_26684/g.55881  ORF Transcript_26684/g.55881 Transcript_26684/m.55881 type:complete len:328 (-) Transcript_26684:181-1164(-)